jgi:uncharacterized membrane protein YhiD involved in acid resistance
MDSFLQNILNNPTTTNAVDSTALVALNLFIAMILGVVVAKTYRRVHRGISYSPSYAYSIVMITMIVTFVMMVIDGNITRAFTLLGAFTIIRYRTAVKDPKDTAFIFLALVLGLAVGASDYALALVGTGMMVTVALLLDKLNFGAMIKLDQVVYLNVDSKQIDQKQLEQTLKSLFKEVEIINVNYNGAAKALQYSYNVRLGKNNDQGGAIKKISDIEGVKSVEILSSQQIIEF